MAGLRLAAAAVALLLAGSALAADLPPPSPIPAELAGTWRWVAFETQKQTQSVPSPERYELTFPEAGRIALKADCNRAAGGVAFGEAGVIRIGVMAMTRAMCPEGSWSDRFAQDVGRAAYWSVQGKSLLLQLPGESGTLRFERQP